MIQFKEQDIVRLRLQLTEAQENITQLKNETLGNVNKLNETMDAVQEDNTMLKDIIAEAKQRIAEMEEENQHLVKQIQ